VASNDQDALVDQDRDQKAEGSGAVGNLADLLLRVGARITRIGFDRLDCDPLHSDHRFFSFIRYAGRAHWLWPALVTDYVAFLESQAQIASQIWVTS
jgi:hypothetical protein